MTATNSASAEKTKSAAKDARMAARKHALLAQTV